MKKFGILFLGLIYFNIGNAQINVRVKNSGNSKEVDIKTGSKPSSSKGNESTGTGTAPKKTTTETTPVQPTKDTSAVPVPSGKPDETYSGPAKVQLRAFWRSLEKLRGGSKTPSDLSNAERMLKQVKENDPSYNVSALETEVTAYRDNANKEAKALSDATGKENEEKNYFKEV